MARLLRFAALSSLAILALSYLPCQASAASVEHLGARAALDNFRGHDAVAKRKRSDTSPFQPRTLQRRCKPKTTSSTHKSTTTKKASSTPKTSSNTSSGGDNPTDVGPVGAKGKVGIAWASGNLETWKTELTLGIYTWSEWYPDNAKSLGFKPCPMFWGPKNQDAFVNAMNKPGYAECALGFNEVNEVGQSNLSPQEALDLWNKFMRPLKSKGIKLGSPSVSSRPNGPAWIKEFLDICGSDCDIDFLAVHYYDTTVEKFKAYIENWHKLFPQFPIWVTEYDCQNFNGGAQQPYDYVIDFHHQVATWMNTLDYVHEYYAFAVLPSLDGVNPDNQMMNSKGEPNLLGDWYIHQY